MQRLTPVQKQVLEFVKANAVHKAVEVPRKYAETARCLHRKGLAHYQLGIKLQMWIDPAHDPMPHMSPRAPLPSTLVVRRAELREAVEAVAEFLDLPRDRLRRIDPAASETGFQVRDKLRELSVRFGFPGGSKHGDYLGQCCDVLRAALRALDAPLGPEDGAMRLEASQRLLQVVHDETRDGVRHFSSESYLPLHIRERLEATLTTDKPHE